MKIITAAICVGGLLTASTAFAESPEKYHSETDIKRGTDGSYNAEVKTEAVDAAGTKTTEKTTQEADTNLLGTQKTHTKRVTTHDPRGLLNKTTETREVKSAAEKDGDYERKSSVKSVDDYGTARKATSTTEVEHKSDGTIKTTLKEKETVDPKGLRNKTTTEVKTTKEQHPDGTVAASREKKVNGEVVEQQ